jgi:hypothetical protein
MSETILTNTSHLASSLSKPVGDAAIDQDDLDYMRERFQGQVHSMVLEAFIESGISQLTLAKRLGHKRADRVCKLLKEPGNWTLNTVIEFVYAASGKEPRYRLANPNEERAYPDEKPADDNFLRLRGIFEVKLAASNQTNPVGDDAWLNSLKDSKFPDQELRQFLLSAHQSGDTSTPTMSPSTQQLSMLLWYLLRSETVAKAKV